MTRFVPVALLLLAGCHQQPPAQTDQDRIDAISARDHQPNRFKMLPDDKGGIYVLDTAYGDVSHCTAEGGIKCDKAVGVR